MAPRKYPELKATQKRRPGRPRKDEISAKQQKARDAVIINEYKTMMVASPKSAQVLKKIMDAALDDNHPNQSQAWKIVTDRVVPVIAFEKDFRESGGKPTIEINIRGVSFDGGQPGLPQPGLVIDAETDDDDIDDDDDDAHAA